VKLNAIIEDYISFQQSTGCSFVTNAILLRAFARAVGDRRSIASSKVCDVEEFLGKSDGETSTWHGKFSRLGSFLKWAASRGHIKTAPLPRVIPKRPPAFVPYIYSREELRRLLRVIDAEPRKNCIGAKTLRALVLTLYGAGLRLREGTNLTCADVDLDAAVLTIRNTKFNKTRLVPVGPQLKEMMTDYALHKGRRPADSPFFTTLLMKAVKPDTFQHNYRILCNHADIRRSDTAEQPRIHDLRHTFAVHRLTSWYQQGANVQRLLHLLSVYLGHVHIRHTQVYLSMTPELLHQASQRFEQYALTGEHYE